MNGKLLGFLQRWQTTRECPACGNDVKKGTFTCQGCGFDFRRLADISPQLPSDNQGNIGLPRSPISPAPSISRFPARSRSSSGPRPTAAEIRRWAREQGYQVSDKGRVRSALVDEYLAATA